MTLRIALFVLLAILSPRAESYPATTGYSYGCGTGYLTSCQTAAGLPASWTAGTSEADACTDLMPFYFGGTTPYCSVSLAGGGVAPDGPYMCNGGGPTCSTPNGKFSISRSLASSSSCPNGGTLSGANCNCAAGEVDTGTACIADPCPAAGVAMGVRDMTVGWALSSTPNADDMVGGFQSPGTSQCVSHGASSCTANVDYANSSGQSGATHCWRGSTPEATGLYRLSCDYPLVSAGTGPCTVDTQSASSPSATSPTCPGTSGTFNGRPICLGVVGNSVQMPQPEAAGNPRAGTSPTTNTNAEREPSTASGGGPDARGGPGVTVGQNGSVGTGNNRAPGSGTTGDAPALELPTDYNREPTQQSILNKLGTGVKVDETGTPTTAVFTDANTAADATQAALEGVAGTVVGDKGSTAWGFGVGLPTGCTNPPPFVFPKAGINYSADLCSYEPQIHMVMTFLWGFLTITGILGMTRRTLTGG